MRSTHRRFRTFGTIAALTLLGGAAGLPAAVASPVVDPAPIGADQYFTGQVDGASAGAVIQVACFGPVTPGETGHPLAGQTVDVMPGSSGSSAAAGYTGSAGTHVLVGFDAASSSTAPVSLTSYVAKAAIPTGLELPCSGTGKVTFTPQPTSATARTATVTVAYVNVGA
jgi:hypothetical protein